jgi:hypothetical protein
MNLVRGLLHIVVFVRVLFGFRQFLEGLVNMVYRCSPVPTPVAAGMVEIVAGSLECTLC